MKLKLEASLNDLSGEHKKFFHLIMFEILSAASWSGPYAQYISTCSSASVYTLSAFPFLCARQILILLNQGEFKAFEMWKICLSASGLPQVTMHQREIPETGQPLDQTMTEKPFSQTNLPQESLGMPSLELHKCESTNTLKNIFIKKLKVPWSSSYQSWSSMLL